MNPDTLHHLLESAIEQSLAGRHVSAKEAKKIDRRLKNAMPDIIAGTSGMVCRTLRKSAPTMLQEQREYVRCFEEKHQRLWKKGLDILETYLHLAFEIGEAFNKNYRGEAGAMQDCLFDVLTRLHARSLQIGFEVLTLLAHGYADGAHARWRTAHEIAVVAAFLKLHGQNTAKKYLEHEGIESYKAMLQYQTHARSLGQQPYPTDEVDRHRAIYEDLCFKHGQTFSGSYGWAAEEVGKGNPNLTDIEKIAGLEHLRPYYRMASHNVHANPKGLRFRLGILDTEDILLAGPSNYGLADPAHGVATSILQVSRSLLATRVNLDSLVMIDILEKFCDEVGKEFLRIHSRIQKQKAGSRKH